MIYRNKVLEVLQKECNVSEAQSILRAGEEETSLLTEVVSQDREWNRAP